MSHATLKQTNGLWFPDDTPVILRAEDRIFCVSKSILAARSTVFQSMFEFPQPATNGEDMMDGRPVVRLHDRAAEVESFLRAIFDSNYFMPPPAEIDFHAVLGILRLSHKYDVPYLFRRAILHLETVYPTEVDRVHSASCNSVNYKNGVVSLDLGAIPILQEVGATWLLPFAFYSVGTYSAQRLFAAGDRWNDLLVDNKQTCLLLAGIQLRATIKINLFLAEKSTCPSAQSCHSAKLGQFRDHLARPEAMDQHPFAAWGQKRWSSLEKQLCQLCFSEARAEYNLAEAQIWEQLPANCGLEGWHLLKEQRRVAMA
ncbi:hypothetical protein B0H13DRAFT_2531208 [Mycena leptocephala]|nr:hypothetical protein B0H13DRAFT_2531208 [Mycena leptocephala]